MFYVIGVSSTAEILSKVGYKETVGRLSTVIKGDERAVLNELSASHIKNYAEFMQQVLWNKWRFREDRVELREKATKGWRGRERRFVLGGEYGVKAAYADVISKAVSEVGQDDLTLRMIVWNMDPIVMEEFD